MEGEGLRKGHWTEEEDTQLVYYVGLLGERPWDFIAKVSGLHRTGKSCRLRWVNYLNPSLKHGHLSPEEQRLIVDLHALWGNRWSRIAKRLPGRTDNEIKNFWRTHMRKRLNEENTKKNVTCTHSLSSLASTSSASSLTSSSLGATETSVAEPQHQLPSNSYSTGNEKGVDGTTRVVDEMVEEDWKSIGDYPMEQLWEDIAMLDARTSSYQDEASHVSCLPQPNSPLWDFYWDSLLEMHDGNWQGQ